MATTIGLLVFLLSASSIVRSEVVKLIVDTDGISDDIRALTVALQHPNAEVIAVTTVTGCVSATQSAANVARTLRANNVQRKIPIYKGAETSFILHDDPSIFDVSSFFGKDGVSDQPNACPQVLPTDNTASWEALPAAQALIELTKQHNLTIAAIGPLTNLALALKIDPTFATRPQRIVIMGGNYYGVGNAVGTSSAETNFLSDPEAASIVINEMQVPITILPWETFFIDGKKQEPFVDLTGHLHQNTTLSDYLNMTTSQAREVSAESNSTYIYDDEVAVLTAIDERVVRARQNLSINVELAGKYTRGQVQVNWVGDSAWVSGSSPMKTVDFVTSYDMAYMNQVLIDAVRQVNDPAMCGQTTPAGPAGNNTTSGTNEILQKIAELLASILSKDGDSQEIMNINPNDL